ncbi:hypothetical protein LR48_Vigan630s000700 [Vigna angularis]|uniref:Uncharacterized protein n=1 Tax=Phaseolus angularis TaxID=3914 RepID=A0A0L9TEP6_PHAAN|nr:hypothetical protein LR48_Vigan630s000700 [Vigna angularis]
MKKSRADALGLESPDLAPPPARHELWKAARTKANGQYTSQSTKEISERIDELVEEQTESIFMGQGREDLLVAAIGRLDHSGRVRVVGGAIKLRDYFGPKPRKREPEAEKVVFGGGKPSQSSRTKVWRRDFTAGAHGGRLGHVKASLFSSLGLLLLPSTMFVSLRFFHGNGEPVSFC